MPDIWHDLADTESAGWTELPVDHGQGLVGFDLVPSEGEWEASGQLLDAAVGLDPGAAGVSSVLLLFQPQIQLNTQTHTHTEHVCKSMHITDYRKSVLISIALLMIICDRKYIAS